MSGAILAGLGGAVARAVLDGSYTAYVRPVMRLPLALAALILIVAGLAVPAGLVRVGRYMIWCCAADAAFGEAFIRWPTGTPARAAGSWFRITGRVQDVKTFDGLTVPVVDATRAQAEPPPAHPYEY